MKKHLRATDKSEVKGKKNKISIHMQIRNRLNSSETNKQNQTKGQKNPKETRAIPIFMNLPNKSSLLSCLLFSYTEKSRNMAKKHLSWGSTNPHSKKLKSNPTQRAKKLIMRYGKNDNLDHISICCLYCFPPHTKTQLSFCCLEKKNSTQTSAIVELGFNVIIACQSTREKQNNSGGEKKNFDGCVYEKKIDQWGKKKKHWVRNTNYKANSFHRLQCNSVHLNKYACFNKHAS